MTEKRDNLYRAPIEIIEFAEDTIPEALGNNIFLLFKRGQFAGEKTALIVPMVPIMQLEGEAMRFQNAGAPIGENSLVVEYFQGEEPASSLRLQFKRDFAIVHFDQSLCIDLEQARKLEGLMKPFGKTHPREFGHIQGRINKVLDNQYLIPYRGVSQFVEFNTPSDNDVPLRNSVWDKIYTERGTPRMQVRDLLNQLESTRVRVQELIDDFGMSVHEARDYLAGIGFEEDTALQKEVSSQLKDLVELLPDAVIKTPEKPKGDTPKTETKTPIYRMLRKGYIDADTCTYLSRYVSSLEELDIRDPSTEKGQKSLLNNVVINAMEHSQKQHIIHSILNLVQAYRQGQIDTKPLNSSTVTLRSIEQDWSSTPV